MTRAGKRRGQKNLSKSTIAGSIYGCLSPVINQVLNVSPLLCAIKCVVQSRYTPLKFSDLFTKAILYSYFDKLVEFVFDR